MKLYKYTGVTGYKETLVMVISAELSGEFSQDIQIAPQKKS